MHISPLPQPIETKKLHLTIFFCGKTCCFGKTITYIFSKNVINFELWPIKSLFQKKYLFRKMSLHKLFQSKLLICTQNQNQQKCVVSFIWKLKAKRFQNTLDLHYYQRIWGRNDFPNLDKAVLLPPKNALFAPLLDIKPFLTMKKWKHCFKWPTPLEWYDWDTLLSLVWGCHHI